MENKNGKVIAIAALVVAVVALSVGFAAFADTLTINGTATAKAGSNPFDTNSTDAGLNYKVNTAECHSTADSSVNVISGSYSAGTASGDSWSGISVPLTTDVPSVTCTAVVENATSYVAYLRSIGANGGVSCSSTGANASANASSVCATVNVVAQFGSVQTDSITFGTTQPATKTDTTGSIAANNSTANGESTVTVTISYTPSNVVADEDVTITLPTISHDYSSASSGS